MKSFKAFILENDWKFVENAIMLSNGDIRILKTKYPDASSYHSALKHLSSLKKDQAQQIFRNLKKKEMTARDWDFINDWVYNKERDYDIDHVKKLSMKDVDMFKKREKVYKKRFPDYS
jgi:hypothetical protein